MKDSTAGKPEKPRYFRPYTRESLNRERPYSRRCLKGWQEASKMKGESGHDRKND